MPNPPPNAICLVVDGLHLGYLGPYGNTWLGTPHCDHLAGQALTFDAAFIDTPDLPRLYRAYWQGIHAAAAAPPAGVLASSLAARLESAGVETILLSDDESITHLELARAFGEVQWIDSAASRAGPPTAAADQEATSLAQYFAQLIARLEGQSEPFLLWAHCGSLGKLWDAPLALRHALVQDEVDESSGPADLRTLLETSPPNRQLPAASDPDELLGFRRAYAAQVAVLDHCLGALDEALAESDLASRTLLVVIGARGFPLGEHRQLGWCDRELHEELIHVPWIMRFPDGTSSATRTPALVQPADLAPTLAAWHGLPMELDSGCPALGQNLLPLAQGDAEAVRDRILLVNDRGQQVLRTPAWLLRTKLPGAVEEPRSSELFVKPDDRWEINEIGDRCPAVVAELEARLSELAAQVGGGESGPLVPLSDECLRGLA